MLSVESMISIVKAGPTYFTSEEEVQMTRWTSSADKEVLATINGAGIGVILEPFMMAEAALHPASYKKPGGPFDQGGWDRCDHDTAVGSQQHWHVSWLSGWWASE